MAVFFLPGSGVTLIFSSDCIKQHAEELEQRAQDDEDVKHGMHPLPALAQSIQNGADREAMPPSSRMGVVMIVRSSICIIC